MTESNDDQMGDPDKSLPPWYALVRETHDCFPMYDHLARQGFPIVKRLRRGILLGCIANALWLAANQGSFAGLQWEGDTYVEDTSQGERWAAAFTPEGAVTVFYSSESERNPWPQGSPPYDQARYFRGMPDTLRAAKERALSWMINFDWGLGGPHAAITAAMWANGERFSANEPWDVVFHNCLWACHRQLLPLDVAVIEWQNQFSLEDEGVAVLRSLYKRRLSSTEATIFVEPWERETILRGREVCTPAARRDDPGSRPRETLWQASASFLASTSKGRAAFTATGGRGMPSAIVVDDPDRLPVEYLHCDGLPGGSCHIHRSDFELHRFVLFRFAGARDGQPQVAQFQAQGLPGDA